MNPGNLSAGTPYIATKDISNNHLINYTNGILIPDTHSVNFKLAPAGSVLICAEGGSAGKKVAHNDRDIHFVNKLFCLSPKESILSKYIYYYLLSNDFKSAFKNQLTGLIGGVSLSKFKNLQIPYINMDNQKCLVAILDEVFADIEQARTKTEQNLKNARELFESYLQQVFSQRGEGWEELTVDQATGGVFTGPFGSLLHKSDYIENGVPLVNPAHITSTGIEPDLRKTISNETAQRLSNYLMSEGDIVIGRRGEMGRCAQITRKEDGYLCGTGSFLIKSSDRVSSDYLVRYLRSSVGRSRLEQIASGAVMLNLSNTELSNLNLYFPPIDKQKEIVKKIGSIATQVEAIEQIYQNKLQALDELKQSILQKAFSGELTEKKNQGAVA